MGDFFRWGITSLQFLDIQSNIAETSVSFSVAILKESVKKQRAFEVDGGSL